MLRYAITDRASHPGNEAARCEALLRQAERLANAGVEFLQVREKDLSAPELLLLAQRLRAVLLRAGGGTKLLLNGSVDLARRADAGGVHVSASRAEAIAKPGGLLLSVACHTIAEVERVRAIADLILFAPVFGKQVHGSLVVPGTGLAGLREACSAAKGVPVFALGGITERNAEACVSSGAAGIAGIRLFL